MLIKFRIETLYLSGICFAWSSPLRSWLLFTEVCTLRTSLYTIVALINTRFNVRFNVRSNVRFNDLWHWTRPAVFEPNPFRVSVKSHVRFNIRFSFRYGNHYRWAWKQRSWFEYENFISSYLIGQHGELYREVVAHLNPNEILQVFEMMEIENFGRAMTSLISLRIGLREVSFEGLVNTSGKRLWT